MGRPKKRDTTAYSEVTRVRLRQAELAGLQALGKALGLSPSRIIRCLIREAINGGPDFFDNGEVELRTMRQHLTAIGRNLNQLARAVNRGDVIAGEELRRVINAGRIQLSAVEELHMRTIEAAAKRAWRPLYREVGLLAPFDKAAEDVAAMGRSSRQLGHGPGQAA